MNILKKSLLVAALVLSATSVQAATGEWEKERYAYTIYAEGMYASSLYYDLSTPRRGAKVTNVEWEFFDYNNGHKTQTVQICYRRPYSNTDTDCEYIDKYSTDSNNGGKEGSLASKWADKDARGTFVMRHWLNEGGTYPARWDYSKKNTIKVSYTY